MADYKTEDERRAERERAKNTKLAADERIALLKKDKEADVLKLRKARKEKAEADKRAKDATLAANAKSNTYPMAHAHLAVGPAVPLVAAGAALVDGRVGSKEDVASWVTAGIGLVTAVGAALMDSPNVALGGVVLMAGGLSSTVTRRSRAWGEKMRAEAGH